MSDPTLFRTKDFLTLIDAMILTARAHTERVTDYNVGSVARTLLEAPGLEIDALYQAMTFNLLDAIPVALYQGFGFTRLPARVASGAVVFTAPAPVATAVTIPAGTVLRAPGDATRYQTQADATIPIGATSVTVAVACVDTGTIGNTLANTLIASAAEISGLTVTNPEPILGGRDPETDDERRARFILYIQSLARGTIASLEYAARMGEVWSIGGLVMERTERVAIAETPGHVDVWIDNGHGNASGASDALLAQVARLIEGYWDESLLQWIPGYRPAGMRVDVHAMARIAVAVTLELDASPTARTPALLMAASEALGAAIRAEPTPGLLRPAELINSVLLLPGIDGARLIEPTHSILVPANAVLIPGEMTVTWNPEAV